MVLNKVAALFSASWGKFQIIGFNHLACGYETVEFFVVDMYNSEYSHIRAFFKFIKSMNLKQALIDKEWAEFVYGYNGKGYRQNKYDEKLAKAYEKYFSPE